MKKKHRRITNITRTNLYALLFTLPWIIGFLMLFITPLIQTFSYSLYKIVPTTDGMSQTFVGFDNYRLLFSTFSYELGGIQYPFIRLMFETISSTLIELPIIIIFSLLIAVLLNQKMRGRGIVRTIFFLPIIFGLPVLSYLNVSDAMSNYLDEIIKNQSWYQILDISFLFSRSGFPPSFIAFMQKSVSNIFDILSFSGVQILIFLSVLQSVNPTLYEVAKIEGANAYETFWKVTLPSIIPMIFTTVVYTFVDALYRSPITQVINDTAFKDGSTGPGVSSAISVIFLFVTMFLLVIIVSILTRREKQNES